MISLYKKVLVQHLSNFLGWSTNRKIVVFESDDWGCIRMPSLEAFNNLRRAGIPVEKSYYNRFDTLESNDDLEKLFEILISFKDYKGNHPAFTGLCVVANPDFDKIRESGYKRYFYEPFTETLKQYPGRDRILLLWKEGAAKRLFVPQFHGREHLNVQRWLRDLQQNDCSTLKAFNNHLWGITTASSPKGYQAAFDIDHPEDIGYLTSVIEEGLDLFENLLGYRAEFFVPPNGPFNLLLEGTLHKKGIRYILLDKRQKEPLGYGKYKTHYRYLGKKNRFKQIYLSRNASFEPVAGGKDWIDKCMKDIDIAFRMKKPATISTHRVNYIGFLDYRNRKSGLRLLSTLLIKIRKTFPNVEYMTSVELGNLIRGEDKN